MLSRNEREQQSFFSSPSRRRLVGAVALLVLAAPMISACGGTGFRPMYAANASGEVLGEKMRQVSVTTIPGRVGQQVRNELVFQTTGGGENLQKNFQLDVVLRERLTTQLVNVEGSAESQIFHLDADFRLTDQRSKEVVLKGQSFGRAGFQRYQTIYSSVRAKRDAENRAARTVAHDIKGRLAAHLSRP